MRTSEAFSAQKQPTRNEMHGSASVPPVGMLSFLWLPCSVPNLAWRYVGRPARGRLWDQKRGLAGSGFESGVVLCRSGCHFPYLSNGPHWHCPESLLGLLCGPSRRCLGLPWPVRGPHAGNLVQASKIKERTRKQNLIGEM